MADADLIRRLEQAARDCCNADGARAIGEAIAVIIRGRGLLPLPVAWIASGAETGDVLLTLFEDAERWKQHGADVTPLYVRAPVK